MPSQVSAHQTVQPQWSPENTSVFMVGVLQYPDGVHWPQEGRRDAVLIEKLIERGVPKERITVLWDAAATLQNIQEKLVAHLCHSKPGELIWFYFAGHGSRNNQGKGQFCAYDGLLPVSEVFRLIEKHFTGAGALLTADCCFSGTLATEAPIRAGRIAYAALTSSMSTVPSTGAWTFTDCLIDGLEGKLSIDADGDGVLRLDELALYTESRMARNDGQLSSFVTVNGFPANLILGQTQPKIDSRVGEAIEGLDKDGRWYKAIILQTNNEQVFVHWTGYSREYDCWLSPERIRPVQLTQYPPGTSVEVQWNQVWYPAEVITERHGMHLIRYNGYGDHWDEWVSQNRIRKPG